MNFRYRKTVIAFLSTFVCITSAGAVRAQAIEVPVERLGEYFYVPVKIKDQPARLVLDSGAGAHCLTPEAARRLGLLTATPDDGPKVRAVGTAGAVDVQRLTTGEIEMGTARLKEGLALAVPLPPVLEADGILGYDLFQQYVVTMDYANGKVTLTPPKDFQPSPDAVALPLRIPRRIPQVEVTIDGISCWVDVDTGSSGHIDLNTPFVEKNKLRDKYTKRIQTPVGRGVGGVTYGEVTRGESLTLGTFTLARPILQLSQQKTGADAKDDVAGRIGSAILSRFVVTFDYSRGKMYLTKAAKGFDAPFQYNRTGIVADKADFYFDIIHVTPGGPGADAGIQVGDQVLAIDGISVAKIPSYQMRDRFRAAPGTTVRLTVRRKDSKDAREVTITLRDLL
jgi:hypothetical protein